jgi:hypothetical protein
MAGKYSKMDGMTAFGFLINGLGGGGDAGQTFPRSDAEDMSAGARFIPGEVTLARRRGERVEFVNRCSPCCWYWEFQDGSRIYHWDRFGYESIGKANGKEIVTTEETTEGGYKYTSSPHFVDGAGGCPRCGNPHTNGGRVDPQGKAVERG